MKLIGISRRVRGVSEKIPFVREVSIFSATTQPMDNETAKMLRGEETSHESCAG